MHAKRSATIIERIPVHDPVDAKYPDGRIAPVSRLARMFFDAIETGAIASPGFAEGYRVQLLIDAARRSHQQGRWIDVARETAKEGIHA
jgi:predicted dehydrogenase